LSYNPRAAINAALAYRSGQSSVISPIYKQVAGEYPDPNFPFLRDIYLRDTDIYTAVNFLSNRALSRGGHVECSAKAPNYVKSECEDFFEDFLKSLRWGDSKSEKGFASLSKIISQEYGYAGTSIYEQIYDQAGRIKAVAAVQISSVWKFQRDYTGQLTAIHQYPQYNPAPLDPENFVVGKWNSVDRNPWGYGLAHSLAYPRQGPRGEYIPPLILTWWQMQNDAAQRLHRSASPRAIFSTKALSKDEIKPMAEALKDPWAAQTFMTNAEVGVAMDSPTARANFAPEFDLIRNRIDIGLNALLSVMLASDKKFAYNSARVGQDISDILVWDLQQNFKTPTDNELLMPVAQQYGYDAQLLEPEWIFNIPDEVAEFNAADALNACVAGKITVDEYREIMRQMAQWPLDETLPVQMQPPPMPPQQDGDGTQPIQGQRPVTPMLTR
jgi:hypothetical protein